MRLRAHHLCCERFMDLEFKERGPAFTQEMEYIKEVMLTQPDVRIMLIEGPDKLCRLCPMFGQGRCNSPEGDEEKVRKLDSILVSELGVTYGDCYTAKEWTDIITPKFPIKICNRCQRKQSCFPGI